jgi:hypothetical protein
VIRILRAHPLGEPNSSGKLLQRLTEPLVARFYSSCLPKRALLKRAQAWSLHARDTRTHDGPISNPNARSAATQLIEPKESSKDRFRRVSTFQSHSTGIIARQVERIALRNLSRGRQ